MRRGPGARAPCVPTPATVAWGSRSCWRGRERADAAQSFAAAPADRDTRMGCSGLSRPPERRLMRAALAQSPRALSAAATPTPPSPSPGTARRWQGLMIKGSDAVWCRGDGGPRQWVRLRSSHMRRAYALWAAATQSNGSRGISIGQSEQRCGGVGVGAGSRKRGGSSTGGCLWEERHPSTSHEQPPGSRSPCPHSPWMRVESPWSLLMPLWWLIKGTSSRCRQSLAGTAALPMPRIRRRTLTSSITTSGGIASDTSRTGTTP